MGESSLERLQLPTFYLEGFAARGLLGAGAIWVLRPAIGEWQRASVEPSGTSRHFNAVADASSPRVALAERVGALREHVSPLLREAERGRPALGLAERAALAEFMALVAITTWPRCEGLSSEDLRAGVASLQAALSETGWVLLSAQPPAYFVTSSSPLNVCYPRPEEAWAESLELRSPGTEITIPLTPALALFATWKRRGELWRDASEDVLMEINARTIQRGTLFLAAPMPALPG